MSEIKKVVLAYSGGLDTSIIIPWLKEHYNNCEVIAVCGNVGQKGELEGLEERAKASGASKLYVEDLTDEFVEDYVIPTMQAPSRRRNPLRHQGYAERRRQRGRPVRRGGGRHPLPPVGPQAAFRRAEAQIGSSTGPRHPGIRSSPRMPRVLPHYGPRHPQTACPGTASAKKSTRHKEKFIDSTICFY